MFNKPTKGIWLGLAIGLGVVASLFYTYLFILPSLLIIFLVRSVYTKRRVFLLVVSMLLMEWLLVKSFLSHSVGYGTLIPLFPLAMLALLCTKVINKDMLRGVYLALAILFALDMIFNLSSFWFGADPLGRTPSLRDDGTRYGGLMGHSFFSIAISVCFCLFSMLLNRPMFVVLIGVTNLFFTGSMRSYIYFCSFILFSSLLAGKKWSIHVLAAIIFVSCVVLACILSVRLGLVNEISGNAFRLYAWVNALSQISENPLLGTWRHFYSWDDFSGISEISISETGTTESALLGDGLHWGLFYVVGKLLIIFSLGRLFNIYLSKKKFDSGDKALAFLPFLMLVDYSIGSLWGGILVAFVFALVIAYGITLHEKNIYAPSF